MTKPCHGGVPCRTADHAQARTALGRPCRRPRRGWNGSSIHAALDAYDFGSPAVGIRSAEAWHERYAWDDDAQYEAIRALQELAPRIDAAVHVLHCAELDTACASRDGCAVRAGR